MSESIFNMDKIDQSFLSWMNPVEEDRGNRVFPIHFYHNLFFRTMLLLRKEVTFKNISSRNLTDYKEVEKFIDDTVNKDNSLKITESMNGSMIKWYIRDDQNVPLLLISFTLGSLTARGEVNAVEEFKKTFDDKYKKEMLLCSYLSYRLSRKDNSITADITNVTSDKEYNDPHDSFYPFFKEAGYTIDSFIEEYLNSPESILVLLGPPGTGKTTFLRYLSFRYYEKYKDDVGLVDNPQVTGEFLGDLLKKLKALNMWIFEDSEAIISTKRKEGNTSISSLLNQADGILTPKETDKKIIFSSNLTDVSQIDPALLRPGRCFAIMNFRKLTREEAYKVAEDLNIPLSLPDNVHEIPLAEITNNRENRLTVSSVKRIGF